jgi:predicted dehydrogenase
MAPAKLRWGVLGAARTADVLVQGLRQSDNVELIAVASRDSEKAREWAESRGVPHHFGSYDALLESDLVDAVYLPLPNALHAAWSRRAAEHGKHVLCEKPIAVNAHEVETLIAVQQKHKVQIMEAFMYRFHPQIARLRRLLADEVIGEPRILRASFDFYLRRPHDVRWSLELGGGALLDVGCYCVNVLNLLLGRPPVSVTASAVWAPSGVDLALAGTLEYPDGVLGIMDCSFQVGTTMQQSLEISGTGGAISLSQPFRVGEEDVLIIADRADQSSTPDVILVPGANEYQLMIEHFSAAVLTGSTPDYTLQDSLANMRVLDALIASARTGQRVNVGSGSA